jgi:hypothetical protein
MMEARQMEYQPGTTIPRPRSLYASLDYQCEVNRILRIAIPEQTGPVLTPTELKRIDAAWHNGLTAAQFAECIVVGRVRAAVRKDQGPMYSSEPIEGVQSQHDANGRYYANAEDARRARIDADTVRTVPS